MFSRIWRTAVTTALLSSTALAQTWSSCNPLHTTCPANTALGMTINVDFRKGSVNSFTASGGPTYGPDGASFTVSRSGEAPQLTSIFYIMFGRVEVTMKAAPGAGIVSSLVLLSDTLDEIDFEWLGADSSEVQTNYFSKGQTTTYNRGQFNPAPNNQAEFITYAIDWTADRIIWYVGGTVVRTLRYADADGQYPQTPMQIKFGAWSGGDPSNNAPGTVEWARGPTDYSQGPFSMVVRSAVVTDYSTGKKYTYTDNSGTWGSIRAEDGKINGNAGGASAITVTASAAPAATNTASPNIPVGGIGAGTETVAGGNPAQTIGPLPEGWRITPDGKVRPIGTSTTPPAACLCSGSPSEHSHSPAPSPETTASPGSGNGNDGSNNNNSGEIAPTHSTLITSATPGADSSSADNNAGSGSDSSSSTTTPRVPNAAPAQNSAISTTQQPRSELILAASLLLSSYILLS
ncbi:concanavalin A-like lectin/glucanase domain-containing protein [Podospora australis]|uniref:Crh-like protein n=1 Tax=Podospora australis TaxID=1536484 RepID=A0AAN6WPW2_9PEZI|nr:concanavalin A-like lectin/glucanase domain-containing protein [Podospora australis]